MMREDYKPEIIDRNFPAQAAFFEDTSQRKIAQCTRRAGKSMGIGRAQLKECENYPGSTQLYLGLTRLSARNIMWENVIKTLNRDLKLGGRPNESYLEMTFPRWGNSKIILAGADASKVEMEKYLGGKYRSIVIDEAGSFRQNLYKLVYENLEPAVSDYEGWIGLTGTPTEITNGLFFDATNGVEPGWSVHRWNTYQNPYMAEKWRRQVERLIKTNPRIIETPSYRRMYLNEWVIDTDSLCYKYSSDRNDITAIPHNDPLIHVLGIDLGFNDPTAFVLLAFGEYDPNCYIKTAYKKSGMIISDVAARIDYFIKKYNPSAIVIDNASKQAVEELKQKFSLPLIAAEKTGKAEFIEIMNSDFILGTLKMFPETDPLKKEYGGLIWDKDKLPKRLEHPNCENHCADAALYGYRYCYQYRHMTKPKKQTEEEKLDAWFDEQAEALECEDKKQFWEE